VMVSRIRALSGASLPDLLRSQRAGIKTIKLALKGLISKIEGKMESRVTSHKKRSWTTDAKI
jgi:hypothetical protein